MQLDRVPPHDIEAEKSVLSCILLKNDSLLTVLDVLKSESFYNSAHRKIFSSMVSLHDDSKPIDIITVSDKLKSMKLLDECGGSYYLTEIMDTVPSAENVKHYADIVNEKYTSRLVIEFGCKTVNRAYDEKPDDIICGFSDFLINMTRKQSNQVSPSESLLRVLDLIGEKRDMIGLPTSLDKLDRYTRGWQKGKLIIIAGRPSHGKSAFALNGAYCAASRGHFTGFITMEMSADELTERMLASVMRINSYDLKRGVLDTEQSNKLFTASGLIADLPMMMDEMPGATVDNIKQVAISWKRKYNMELLIIDYLQLMEHKGDNLNNAIGDTTRKLKQLSLELQIPVIVLSQLSRGNDRENRHPRLSDLRDSGNIEQDADIVLFIHNPDYNDDQIASVAEFIMAKQRGGPTVYFNATFMKQYTTFENYIEGSIPF